jgi:starch synthase
MYSMRYGTLPVMRATGGLRDTGKSLNPGTGEGDCFKFDDLTPDALTGTVSWAAGVYRKQPELHAAMVQRAMARDFSWERAARTYDYFYRLACLRRRGG